MLNACKTEIPRHYSATRPSNKESKKREKADKWIRSQPARGQTIKITLTVHGQYDGKRHQAQTEEPQASAPKRSVDIYLCDGLSGYWMHYSKTLTLLSHAEADGDLQPPELVTESTL